MNDPYTLVLFLDIGPELIRTFNSYADNLRECLEVASEIKGACVDLPTLLKFNG